MIKKILIIICLLLMTGCQKINFNNYVEKSKVYTIGEEKVLIEYAPEKPAYTEKVLKGKTTSWGLKSRYEVGIGKDIEPGVYNINTKGWANYNIFVGAIDLNFDKTSFYTGTVFLDPLQQSVCYIEEISCSFNSYKRVERIKLFEGDVLYASYTPYNGQSVSMRFEAQYVEINHEKTEEQPEIKAAPLEVKESIRKYSNELKCYINDYEVSSCNSLNYYDELLKQFN